MATAEELRDIFKATIQNWQVRKPAPNKPIPDPSNPIISGELQGVLLKSYDRLMEFAKQWGELRKKEEVENVPAAQKKYVIGDVPLDAAEKAWHAAHPYARYRDTLHQTTRRTKIKTTFVQEEILYDITNTEQIRSCLKSGISNPDTLEKLMGLVIHVAAQDAETLGYLPNQNLILGEVSDIKDRDFTTIKDIIRVRKEEVDDRDPSTPKGARRNRGRPQH